MNTLRKIGVAVTLSLAVNGAVVAESKFDPFYLPQANQPFEGTVDTRIGTLEFNNQYPSKDSMQTILDSMDFHGATQAFLWGIPMASMANFQHYNRDVFKVRQGGLVQYVGLKKKLGILTGNATTPYILGTVNLQETGPYVIDLPAGAIGGMVDDFWQRPVTDIGLAGPDKGKGAKYLITSPGYKGEKPKGYLVFESPTNNIFVGLRMLDKDPKKASALLAKVQTYSYKDRANPPKSGFPSPTAKYYFGPPRGMAYWERLHEILNREVVAERDRFFMAMLKRVGIEKGKPFNPTPRQMKILEQAAFVGEAMAKANDLAKRNTEPYWPDANWKLALGLDPSQRATNYDELDERAEWFYEAVSSSNAMVTTTPGVGSIYLASYADKDGDWLDGAKSYTLHIPAKAPAEQFWSIAVYSWDSRTLIDNDQKRAAQSSRQDLIVNADGSIDLYYGPKAPEGKEKNWVQTIPGQGWWVYLRFYAPTKAYFDKSWSMGDFEKVK
ncbi:DUF1254 domain-containing protein [Methyloprofundus sp.]|uniref:DUF1254 domain-containing protein n=1 Tax=Methyloprofundus sp. TaxID=2020875 RepID=UPI003D1513F2